MTLYNQAQKLLNALLANQFIRYAIVGAFSTLLDTVILFFMVQVCKADLTIAKFTSQSLSIINGYYWNRKWTFPGSAERVHHQFGKFALVSIVGLVIGVLSINAFTKIFNIWYILANVLTAFITLIWNFNINRIFTFKK